MAELQWGCIVVVLGLIDIAAEMMHLLVVQDWPENIVSVDGTILVEH
jgi:hypothetical protein